MTHVLSMFTHWTSFMRDVGCDNMKGHIVQQKDCKCLLWEIATCGQSILSWAKWKA